MKVFLSLFLITWALCASAAERDVSFSVANARAIVQNEFASKAPGMSVAVAVDGKIVWSEGFGLKDVGAKKRVTTETLFRIGSISKSLTSVGLALLVESGKLDLDAPVQKYVPDFPNKNAVITTRQLGGHLAGIRHYRSNEMFLNRTFRDTHSALTIFKDDPLVSAPGTKFFYSTYGWTLISAVMESAAHQDFVSYMDKNVIQPLKLEHTHADRSDVFDTNCTLFYSTNAQGEFVTAPSVNSSYKWAGGGYLSTSEDLVRFGSALMQPGFLKKQSFSLLFTSQKNADSKPTGYGVGWFIGKDADGHHVYWHSGGSIGGTGILLLHPVNKTAVAILGNRTGLIFDRKNMEAIVHCFSQAESIENGSKVNPPK